MKSNHRILSQLVLVLILLFCEIVHAQAEIGFYRNFYDFGDIHSGDIPEIDFHFTNFSDDDLIIVDARGDADITVSYPRNRPIARGRLNSIKVRLHTTNYGVSKYMVAGIKIQETITISSNSTRGRDVVRIKARVFPPGANITKTEPKKNIKTYKYKFGNNVYEIPDYAVAEVLRENPNGTLLDNNKNVAKKSNSNNNNNGTSNILIIVIIILLIFIAVILRRRNTNRLKTSHQNDSQNANTKNKFDYSSLKFENLKNSNNEPEVDNASSFGTDPLEIKDEVNKETIKENFKNELNSFDTKKIASQYDLDEKNLDIKFWYEIILKRFNFSKDLKNFTSEEDRNIILLDSIFSHADEYGKTYEKSSKVEKRNISLIRILCYGHILKCLEKFHLNDDLSQLKIVHAKASLYGVIKFALFSGISKADIKQWYPPVEFNHDLISGSNPFERLIKEIYDTGNDKEYGDAARKIKIIFDDKERIPIYELSEFQKKNAPNWFKGPFYEDGGIVESFLTGNKIELNNIEKSIFTEVQLNTLLIEKLVEKGVKRADFEHPFLSNLVLVVDSGTLWLESNNKEAHNKLFN